MTVKESGSAIKRNQNLVKNLTRSSYMLDWIMNTPVISQQDFITNFD